SYTSGGDLHAFLYSGGQMIDLSQLASSTGWSLQYATGINDSGRIVGYGINTSGKTEAFAISVVAAIPEPTVGIYMGAGLMVLAVHGLVRRRRS
ncbi:MAG: hypothetical protein ACREKL_14520, partial [Chthoniobacterales bacterium]